MNNVAELINWLNPRVEEQADPEKAKGMAKFIPGAGIMLGVSVPNLRKLAKDASKEFKPDPEDWIKFLSLVVPQKHREMILIGVFGLGKKATRLDDLFGEKVSGWARELDNWETVDQLSVPVGAWVLEDMSRIGYPESWVKRGETLWKIRLGVATTVQLNHAGNSHPAETFQVLRHTMPTEDKMLIKAIGWACREVKDHDALEKFLTEWAPKCRKSLITQASQKLPEESKQNILRNISK